MMLVKLRHWEMLVRDFVGKEEELEELLLLFFLFFFFFPVVVVVVVAGDDNVGGLFSLMQTVRWSRTLLSRCRTWDDVWDMID